MIVRVPGTCYRIPTIKCTSQAGDFDVTFQKYAKIQKHKACLAIPVDLRSINIEKALAIAMQNNIYAYDAYFLECAKNLRCSLLTLDRQLKSVCGDLGIKILEF